MGFLAGKKLLITGVLSNRSIAYGIAKACHQQGAELAFSYVGERFKDRITEFAADFDSKLIFDCDVGSDEQIDAITASTITSRAFLEAVNKAYAAYKESNADTSPTACLLTSSGNGEWMLNVLNPAST